MRATKHIFILSYLLNSCLATGQHNQPLASRHAGGVWKNLAPVADVARQEHTTVAISPTTLYILGGIVPFPPNSTTDPTTTIVQSYSISQNTWLSAAPLPKPLNHINAAAVNGKIYVLGGLIPSSDGSWQGAPDCYVYDPYQNTWAALPSMPSEQARGSAAVVAHENKIYLAGGLRALVLMEDGLQDTVDIVSVYDIATQEWTLLPGEAAHLPSRRDHAGAAVVGDIFYVVGGRDRGQRNVRDTVFTLDLCDMTRGWQTRAGKMPTPRGGLSAGVVDGKIYTFGGEGNPDPGSQGVYNETEVYDTVRDQWNKLAPMQIPRHGTSAVAIGRTIYIPGGGVAQGSAPVDTFNAFEV